MLERLGVTCELSVGKEWDLWAPEEYSVEHATRELEKLAAGEEQPTCPPSAPRVRNSPPALPLLHG